MSLVLQSSGGGQITIQEPATASNRTITLPDATGTGLVNPLSSAALGAASAGLIEYDGKAPYITPQGTQRGVIPSAQFYRLNADLAGANTSVAQNIFGVGVTLSSGTVYAFESVYALNKTAGTTSHDFSFGFGGTATLNNIGYTAYNAYNYATLDSAMIQSNFYQGYIKTASFITTQTAFVQALVNMLVWMRGTVSINAGGTFLPQYKLSAAPGGAYTTAVGSYFLIYPIGASGANTSVGTWA